MRSLLRSFDSLPFALPRPALQAALAGAALAGALLAAAPRSRAAEPAAAPSAAPAAAAPSAAAPASIDSAVRWMPQGAQLVVRVRFADMRTSSLFRSLMTSKPLFASEMAPLEQFAAAAGIDLGRDLELGWIGTDGREAGASVAVVSGKLEGTELGARLTKRGATTASHAGVTLYTLPRPRSGATKTAPTVAAFPGPGVALVGALDWVSTALDRMQGRGNGPATPLLTFTGRMDSVATIWSAAAGPAVSEKIRQEWSTGQLGGEDLSGIDNLVATVRIAQDVKIDSEAMAAGEDADALALTLKGLIAVSGLRASMSDPSLAEVLKGTTVQRTSGGVRLTSRLPASFASRL